jgi:hypothetical protein
MASKKLSVGRYVAGNPMLIQLKEDYGWLVQQIAIEKLPIAAGKMLAEEYVYQLSRIDPNLDPAERNKAEQVIRTLRKKPISAM